MRSEEKYFDRERAFEFIWQNANPEGIWDGDAASLAGEFDVSADTAHSVLGELCDLRHIERLYTAKYIIVKWREKETLVEEGVESRN